MNSKNGFLVLFLFIFSPLAYSDAAEVDMFFKSEMNEQKNWGTICCYCCQALSSVYFAIIPEGFTNVFCAV